VALAPDLQPRSTEIEGAAEYMSGETPGVGGTRAGGRVGVRAGEVGRDRMGTAEEWAERGGKMGGGGGRVVSALKGVGRADMRKSEGQKMRRRCVARSHCPPN